MGVGENIKFFRKQKGLTQKELGEIIHMSPNSIQRYELGHRDPQNKTLEEIAKALGVSMADLLGIENSFAKITKENQVKRREYTKTYTTDELKELEKDSFLIKCSEKEKALKLLTFLNLSEEIINSPLLEKSERKKFSELCGTIIDNWSNYMNENVYDSIINTSIELSKVNENN